MTQISPNYYAAGELVRSYVLRGERFDSIPSDAVGIYATENIAPLQNRYQTDTGYLFSIDSNTGSEMVLHPLVPLQHSSHNFLGGIVSADRQIVYWENNTMPLPS